MVRRAVAVWSPRTSNGSEGSPWTARIRRACARPRTDGDGVIVAGPAITGQFLASFKEFPPSQRPSSFSIDQIMEKVQRSWDVAGVGN
jgi:hypothetical protein